MMTVFDVVLLFWLLLAFPAGLLLGRCSRPSSTERQKRRWSRLDLSEGAAATTILDNTDAGGGSRRTRRWRSSAPSSGGSRLDLGARPGFGLSFTDALRTKAEAGEGDVSVAAEQRLSGMKESAREQAPLAQTTSGQGLHHRDVACSDQHACATRTVQVEGLNRVGVLSESETGLLVEQAADCVGSRSWPRL